MFSGGGWWFGSLGRVYGRLVLENPLLVSQKYFLFDGDEVLVSFLYIHLAWYWENRMPLVVAILFALFWTVTHRKCRPRLDIKLVDSNAYGVISSGNIFWVCIWYSERRRIRLRGRTDGNKYHEESGVHWIGHKLRIFPFSSPMASKHCSRAMFFPQHDGWIQGRLHYGAASTTWVLSNRWRLYIHCELPILW